MHIRDYNDAMKFFRDSKQLESNGKWKEFVEESKFDDMLQESQNMAHGGRIGFADGPPGKLVIQKPKMTLEKQKISSTPLKEDYLGQLKDKRKVRTSTLDDAFEVRNIIVKNKGHVGNIEELGKLAGIYSGKKVDQRKTQLALDLALDSFEELKGFKLAIKKYPNIDKSGKKFRYLDMVAKSFANYNMTDDAIEAAAHLMPDNMAMIYDYDVTKKKTLEKGFFNLRGKITSADKKFISDRVATLTGKDFNIDSVNELIEETSKVRYAEGSIAAQLKRNAKMNEQILDLTNDNTIKNLLKGDLNNKTQAKLLERATNIVGGDASIASRRLFQMAEGMSDATNKYKDLEIKLNNNIANKIIATGRQIGGNSNRYGMSSALYSYYGNVVDKALGATEGNSFIGKYQQQIKKLLDAGQSPDEIFSLTASGSKKMSPYAIFTQRLRTDVNSAIKGAFIDSELSTKHGQLQKIFQGKTYDKLNTQEKEAVQKLVSDFEKTKIDALNKPTNPGKVRAGLIEQYGKDSTEYKMYKKTGKIPSNYKGVKPDFLTGAEKKNIQLPEFDLKNPPSKSIKGYDQRFKNYPKIKKAFEESYKKVGYGMKVKPGMLTQIEFLQSLGYGKGCKATGGRVSFAEAGDVGPGQMKCIMSDVEKTRADMKSPNVEVRAKALTKQRTALQLASKIPQLKKILKTGVQLGTAAITKPLQALGLTSGLGYAIEGLIEGGFYDNARRKGYSHEQAMAETLTPGLIAGRPEDVPWYGGSEKLREKELYEIKGRNEFIDVENRPPMQDPEFEKVIGTRGKVKQYVDALKEQDRIYEAIGAKEQAKKEAGLAETGFDATLLPADLSAASADVQDLARSGAYRRVDQTLRPESMASQAYNTAVENRDALDQRRRTEYLEKVEPRFLEREKESFDTKRHREKRYREMKEKFPGYSDEQIDEILAYYETSQPEVGMSYDQLKNMFDIGDKQAYFADNFRMEKAQGGIMNLKKKW